MQKQSLINKKFALTKKKSVSLGGFRENVYLRMIIVSTTKHT